ncbi:hypothetical protein ACIRD0_37465 [Streptomyces microflavus]|uniref:hypothetical protein n=1 Tax=Streptomyces microflavus TaxID=1919 RepID=UPI0037F57F9E
MPRTRRKRAHKATRVPRSDALLPEYDRGMVPEGLVTRRVLRDMGLSPGDNEGPVAILRCRLCATRPQWSCRHPAIYTGVSDDYRNRLLERALKQRHGDLWEEPA